MEVFKDAEGREWCLRVTISTVKDVRSFCDLDLLDNSGEAIRSLGDDACKLADVLYVCCKEDAEKKGITDVQFGEGLRGEAIDTATEAFLKELINFFPKKKGQMMNKVLEKAKSLQDEAVTKIEERIENLSLEELMNSPE